MRSISLRLRKLFVRYADKVVLPKSQKKKILKSKNLVMTIINVANESDIEATTVGKEVSKALCVNSVLLFVQFCFRLRYEYLPTYTNRLVVNR